MSIDWKIDLRAVVVDILSLHHVIHYFEFSQHPSSSRSPPAFA